MQNRKGETKRNRFVIGTLWAANITNALCQAAQNGTSLYSLPKVITPVVLISFVTNINLSNTFSIEGADEIMQIINDRKLPYDQRDWPELSKVREALSVGSMFVITGISAYFIGVQAYYFASLLPKNYDFEDSIAPYKLAWEIGSGAASALVVLNLAVGQGRVTYKNIRKLLSSQKIEYTSTFSRYYSSIVGGFLGGIYALANGISNFPSISMHKTPEVCINAAFIPFDAVGNFCMNGRFGIDSIDQLAGYLSEHCPDITEVVSFFISAGLSGFFNYWQYIIIKNTLEMNVNNLEINAPHMTEPIIAGLSLGYAAEGFIIDTATLYQLTFIAVNGISKKISSICQWLSNSCCQPNQEDSNQDNQSQKDIEDTKDIEAQPLLQEPQDETDRIEVIDPDITVIVLPSPKTVPKHFLAKQGIFANYGAIEEEPKQKTKPRFPRCSIL